MLTIVTLAEKSLTPHDVDRLANLHGADEVRVHLIVAPSAPQNRLVEALDDVALGHLGRAVRGEEEVTPEAEELEALRAVNESVAALTAAGVEADGSVGGDDPVASVSEAVSRLDADEVIVVTEPHFVEESLHRDWASRLRDRLDRPVLHVVAGTDRVVS